MQLPDHDERGWAELRALRDDDRLLAGSIAGPCPLLRRGPIWHRIGERIAVPAGVLVALSGLQIEPLAELEATEREVCDQFCCLRCLNLPLVVGLLSWRASFFLAHRASFEEEAFWQHHGPSASFWPGAACAVH
jgi:hypothetical protein